MQQLKQLQEQQKLIGAIAMQQAQLYHNLQTLKTELEAKVEERTTALQESDRWQHGGTGYGNEIFSPNPLVA